MRNVDAFDEQLQPSVKLIVGVRVWAEHTGSEMCSIRSDRTLAVKFIDSAFLLHHSNRAEYVFLPCGKFGSSIIAQPVHCRLKHCAQAWQ